MRIAVTGGSGRAVAALALSQGHSAVSIDRVPPAPQSPQQGLTFVEADTTQYAELAQAFRGCDAVVHLAAIPAPGWQPDHVVHDNNVVSSYHALRAAAELGIRRVCQASSVNATGLSYSRWPRFDYFPLDEAHPTYNEDPYSLSKWLCEAQGDSIARRYEAMSIASLRFHWVVADRAAAVQNASALKDTLVKQLWGYTSLQAAARACLLSCTAHFEGHEVFYIVAPDTMMDVPSLELQQQFFLDVPVRGDLSGTRGFFDCRKAERVLGWKHDESSVAHPVPRGEAASARECVRHRACSQ